MTESRAQFILNNLIGYEFRWAFECPLNQPPFFTGEKKNIPIISDGIKILEYNRAVEVWNMMVMLSGPGKSFYDVIEAIAKGFF